MSKNAILLENSFEYDDLDITVTHFIKRNISQSWNASKDQRDGNITYIRNGTAIVKMNGKTSKVGKGDVVYTPKGSNCQIQADGGTTVKVYSLDFKHYYINSGFRELPFSTVMNIDTDIPLISLYEELNSIWIKKEIGHRLKARGIAMQIFYEIIINANSHGDTNDSNNRIDLVKEYIIERYDQDIQIDQLASMLNLNPVYFGSYFKKKTGYTVRQYINYIRISMAKGLLLSGNYSVGEAAYQCGFQDMFYFSKVFKQIEGIPPSFLIR